MCSDTAHTSQNLDHRMKYLDHKTTNPKGQKMPNWIYNRVDIHTTHPELKKILQQLADAKTHTHTNQDQGFFSLFFPRPSDEQDWYTWSIRNWGTKWDVDADVIPTDAGFQISFNSAWSAPHEFLFELAYRFNQDGHHTTIDSHFIGLDEAIYGYMTTTPDITKLVSEQPELVKSTEIGWIGECYDVSTIHEANPTIAQQLEEKFPGFSDICKQWFSDGAN